MRGLGWESCNSENGLIVDSAKMNIHVQYNLGWTWPMSRILHTLHRHVTSLWPFFCENEIKEVRDEVGLSKGLEEMIVKAASKTAVRSNATQLDMTQEHWDHNNYYSKMQSIPIGDMKFSGREMKQDITEMQKITLTIIRHEHQIDTMVTENS